LTLAALVMTAPMPASADCDDAHEADCAPECVCACACCTVTALADQGPATSLASPEISRLCVAADTFVGDLLPADIFRPPPAS
jgi:hypothetical protein